MRDPKGWVYVLGCSLRGAVGWFVRFLLPVIGLLAVAVLLPCIGRWLFSDVNVGVETLRVLLSWPVALVLIAILVLANFREPLGELIRGVKLIRGGGIEAIIEQMPKEQGKGLPYTDKEPREGEINWDAWLLELSEKLSAEEPDASQGTVTPLEKRLKYWVSRWWFEKIWNVIYSTQISLLERLLSAEGWRLGLEDVKPYYEEHVLKRSQSDSLFRDQCAHGMLPEYYRESYFNFLQSAHLAKVEAGGVKATELATKFLEYMRDQGYHKSFRVW